MPMTEIISPTRGLIGWLHGVDCSNEDTVLIFQLPRKTEQLNPEYIAFARNAIAEIMPAGRRAILIGCDVNIIEITSADLSALKLKGIL